MKIVNQLRFETKVMDVLAEEYRERGENFDIEQHMACLHQCLENAAMDFAEMLELEYTPVYGG